MLMESWILGVDQVVVRDEEEDIKMNNYKFALY
jgi:hypothetical protein